MLPATDMQMPSWSKLWGEVRSGSKRDRPISLNCKWVAGSGSPKFPGLSNAVIIQRLRWSTKVRWFKSDNLFIWFLSPRSHEKNGVDFFTLTEWRTGHVYCYAILQTNRLCSNLLTTGRPILIGNLTFVWRSPIDDVGPIRVVGSVVYNNAYVKIDGNRGREIPFKSFPVSTHNTIFANS